LKGSKGKDTTRWQEEDSVDRISGQKGGEIDIKEKKRKGLWRRLRGLFG
jgi:hypothetical protein